MVSAFFRPCKLAKYDICDNTSPSLTGVFDLDFLFARGTIIVDLIFQSQQEKPIYCLGRFVQGLEYGALGLSILASQAVVKVHGSLT